MYSTIYRYGTIVLINKGKVYTMSEETERLTEKRVVVNVTEEEHRKIKEESTKRGLSIKKFVLRAILFYAHKVNG